MAQSVPSTALNAVLQKSQAMPEGSETVRGYDFNQGVDYHKLLESYRRSGFQATNFGLAVNEINRMLEMKARKPELSEDEKDHNPNPSGRERTNCTIFLGETF